MAVCSIRAFIRFLGGGSSVSFSRLQSDFPYTIFTPFRRGVVWNCMKLYSAYLCGECGCRQDLDLLTKWRANPFYAKRTIGRMRHINGQLPEKYGGSSTAVYENADGALLKALVNGFLPGMILYSFPRNTTAPFSLTSVSMTLTIRCWAKASFSTM